VPKVPQEEVAAGVREAARLPRPLFPDASQGSSRAGLLMSDPIDQVNDEIVELQSRLDDRDDAIKTLEERIEELNAELDRVRQALVENEEALAEAQDEIDEQDRRIRRLQRLLDDIQDLASY
jgi:septal ring factor EnvC (AmiA/AmiB activator)